MRRLLLIPLLAQTLHSQNEEIPAIPGLPANQVPAQQALPNANAQLGDTLIQESIEQLKLSGDDLADLYRKYTGRRVIVASSAAQAEFRFVQPASPQDPLTYREAAELLKKAATIENFVFVPDAVDPNLDILTLATAGLKPTSRGVQIFKQGDVLPEGDAVISYVMPLKHIKPDEAVRTFQQVVGQFGAFGSIAAVPNVASIVITENTALIRKLIELQSEIDKPSSVVDSMFFDVKFADVTELSETLTQLLEQNESSTNTANVQRAGQAPVDPASGAVNAQGGGNASSAGEDIPIKIIPDARTNRLFAMGRPVDLIFVKGLVSKFDIESDQRNFYTRKLRYLTVTDFLPIAGDALTRAFSGTGTAEGGAQGGAQGQGGSNRQQTRPQQQNNNTLTNSGGGGFGGGSGFGSGGGGFGSSGGGSRGTGLSDPQLNSAPESLLIGRTLLVADNITNTIVVQGPPTAVEIIENLLEQVDVKADQIMISTVFGQLSLGDNITTGVDWLRSYRGDNSSGIAGSLINGGTTNSIDPTSIINTITGTAAGTFPSRTGLSLYGKMSDSLGAYVSLLSSSSDFTVLSRPSIFAANNTKGTISSGRRIAVPTNSNQFGGSGGVSTNIEYRDVVLKLEVIPLVNSDNEITLQIALVSDDIIGESEEIVGVGSVPIIGTRELLTTVTVPNNQTVVLGGLITTNDTESMTGIPVLSDIPGLGRLFSRKTNGVERDELMIFIQPSIVKSGNSLDYVQADMDSRYKVSEPARKFADGSVLPPKESISEKGSNAGSKSKSPSVTPETRMFKNPVYTPAHRR